MKDKIDLNKYAGHLDGKERARLLFRDYIKKGFNGSGFLSKSEKQSLSRGMLDYDRNQFDQLIKACNKALPDILWQVGLLGMKFEMACSNLDKLHLGIIQSKGLQHVRSQLINDVFVPIQTEGEYLKFKLESEVCEEEYSLVIKDGKNNPLLQETGGELLLRNRFLSSLCFIETLQVIKTLECRPFQGDKVRFKQGFGEKLKKVCSEYHQYACQLLTYSALLDKLFAELQFNPCEEFGKYRIHELVSTAKEIAKHHNDEINELLRDEVAEALNKQTYGKEEAVYRELENKDIYLIPEFILEQKLYQEWDKRMFKK